MVRSESSCLQHEKSLRASRYSNSSILTSQFATITIRGNIQCIKKLVQPRSNASGVMVSTQTASAQHCRSTQMWFVGPLYPNHVHHFYIVKCRTWLKVQLFALPRTEMRGLLNPCLKETTRATWVDKDECFSDFGVLVLHSILLSSSQEYVFLWQAHAFETSCLNDHVLF